MQARLKKILITSSEKGGSGKTSYSNTFIAYLARKKNEKGQPNKILAIDNDPEHCLTGLFNLNKQQLHASEMYRAYYAYDTSGELPKDFHPISVSKNVDIITASPRLETVDTLMRDNASIADLVLSQMLIDIKAPQKYDWIIIDDAPAMNLLTINSYVCADDIICPVDPGIFDLKSINIMKDELNRLKKTMKSPTNLHKSLIKAKLIFIADRVKSNTKSSKIFRQFVKQNPDLFHALFREREIVNRANSAGTNVFHISRDNSSDRHVVEKEIKPNLDKLYNYITKDK